MTLGFLQAPHSGFSNAAEFMVSPLPFVTQSTAGTSTPTTIVFPFISSYFMIRNTSTNTLFLGFTASGSAGTNRFTIPGTSSFGPVNMRIKNLYFLATGSSATFDLLAGLTTIPTRGWPILTGSSPTTLNISSSLYDPYFTIQGGVG